MISRKLKKDEMEKQFCPKTLKGKKKQNEIENDNAIRTEKLLLKKELWNHLGWWRLMLEDDDRKWRDWWRGWRRDWWRDWWKGRGSITFQIEPQTRCTNLKLQFILRIALWVAASFVVSCNSAAWREKAQLGQGQVTLLLVGVDVGPGQVDQPYSQVYQVGEVV